MAIQRLGSGHQQTNTEDRPPSNNYIVRLEGSRQTRLGESRQKHVGTKCYRGRGKTERRDAGGRSHLAALGQCGRHGHGRRAQQDDKVSGYVYRKANVLIVNKKNMYSQTSISVFSFMSLRSKLDLPALADPQQAVSNGLVR